MTDDQIAQARCREHEGLRLDRYRCSTGHWTIGYGHRCPASQPPVTQEQADRLFAQDWAVARRWVAKKLEYRGIDDLDDVRIGVLTEMAFQLGGRGCAGFFRMWRALSRRHFETAAQEMLDSKWAIQTPRRCELLSGIMRSGVAE